MAVMWDVGTVTIGQLISRINNSSIGLPQFQRKSVWTKKDWTPFLTTLLRGRPTGTLLLLGVGNDGQEFAPREIEDGPPIDPSHLKWLLLDGQQRTTTVFKALKSGFGDKGKPKKEFVLDVKAAIDAGELLEEHLELTNSSRIPVIKKLAKLGQVTLRTLMDDEERASWLATFSQTFFDGPIDETIKLSTKKINETIPGFASMSGYEFPILEIKGDTPLDVVVDIFESMNRRGQKLNQFDLMVARVYKPIGENGFYDLRSKFEEMLSNSKNLQLLGIEEEDGMLPLQLIAMQVFRMEAVKPPRLTGLANKDVLEVPIDQIIGQPFRKPHDPKLNFDRAMEALEQAADFLVKYCGVRSQQMLPQKSMLLPIADQYLLEKELQLQPHLLKRWFFSVGLLQEYYGGVNAFAFRDCKALREWGKDPEGATPSVVERLDKAVVSSLNLRNPMSREGDILGKSLMCLLVAQGCLDWQKGQTPVQNLEGRVDFHHMVPEKKLKSFYKDRDDRRPIANFTPILQATNASLSDDLPPDVIQRLGPASLAILQSHHISKDIFSQAAESRDAFEKMLLDREKRLQTFVVEALGLQ